tara:strand:+ start:1070 stop:2419 length:1350 start_codon:yes stop_codon:yes gene_type:complete
MIRAMDLFAGIGGFSLGLERTGGFETAVFCEIEDYPQKVLKKNWPDVPIHDDIKTLKGDEYGSIGLICGGYPCQPFSAAGQRGGTEDDRHLWPEMYRIIKTVRPRWIIAENVAGHISMGLDSVLSDLEDAHYRWWTFVLPACSLNALHRRDRVWIVGYTEYDGHPPPEGRRKQQEPQKQKEQGTFWEYEGTGSASSNVADTEGMRSGGRDDNECESGGRILVSGEQGRGKVGSETEGCSSESGKTSTKSKSKKDDADTNSKRLHRKGVIQHGKVKSDDRKERESGQIREVLADRGGSEIGDTQTASNTDRSGQHPGQGSGQSNREEGNNAGRSSEDVADTSNQRLQRIQQSEASGQREGSPRSATECSEDGRGDWGSIESGLGELADGLSRRMDGHYWGVEPDIPRLTKNKKNRASRLKCLGNAIVPPIATLIGYAILEMEGANDEEST